jgi:hypothetical protein
LHDGLSIAECADDPMYGSRSESDESWRHKDSVFQRSAWFAKYVHELNLMPIRQMLPTKRSQVRERL